MSQNYQDSKRKLQKHIDIGEKLLDMADFYKQLYESKKNRKDIPTSYYLNPLKFCKKCLIQFQKELPSIVVAVKKIKKHEKTNKSISSKLINSHNILMKQYGKLKTGVKFDREMY